jgi:clan AA aspartic protease (TIGR02281 family)
MMRSKIGQFILVFLLMASTVSQLHADDLASSPQEIFKSKGLIKTGFMLILPQEQELHDAAAVLRTARGKLAAAAAKIRDADAQIKIAARNLKASEDDLHDTDVRMAHGQNDNQTIGQHNLLIDQIKEQLNKLQDLTTAKDKLLVSRSDYITAALDASEKADVALHAYDVPRADKDLSVAIDKYNLTAKPKVKLGPSAYFNEDLELVKQCKADVTSGSIPITTDGGVPNVEVLLNGTFTQTFIWDSGATMVSLSAKTAKALDLHPTKSDPEVVMTIADGRHVKAHIMTLDSIRIGGFTVEHVECLVPPNGTEGADLLGNDFQHHFQFKLDIGKGTLQLTPLDSQAAATKTVSRYTVQPADKPSAAPVDPVAKPDKTAMQKTIDRLAGTWFLPKNGTQYTLDADGTATAQDGNKGTWAPNAAGSIINVKWAKHGWTEVFRLSAGKWTKYTYQDGTLKDTDEISPP